MILDISPASWQLWCFAALSLFIIMVVESDLREQRISNAIVVLMLVAGVALNVLGPANGRGGLLSHFPGALGASGAMLGALVGLALLLPLYLMRTMGAGDVKLMAALGSFVGPVETFSLVLTILAVGGVLAVVRSVWTRKSRVVFGNVMLALDSFSSLSGGAPPFDPVTQSADRMPYALAFAGGLLAYGYWRLVGGVPFLSF